MMEGQLRSKIGYMSEPMCFCMSRYCQVSEESHKIVKFNMKPWYANNLLAYISSLSVGLVKSCRLLQRRMHHRRPISLLLSFLAFSPPHTHVLSSPLHALSLSFCLGGLLLPAHCSFCRHMCGILNVWLSDHQLWDDEDTVICSMLFEVFHILQSVNMSCVLLVSKLSFRTNIFLFFEVLSKSPDYMVEGQRQSESDGRTDRQTEDGNTLHILSPK